MGLSKGIKKQLKTVVQLYRRDTPPDAFGNPIITSSEAVHCVLAQSTSDFGTGTEGEEIRSTPMESTMMITDYLGIKVGDRVVFPFNDGQTITYFEAKRKVSEVVTYRDAKGVPMFQESTVITQ